MSVSVAEVVLRDGGANPKHNPPPFAAGLRTVLGGVGSVVRESRFPRFDPLAGQDEKQFFCPTESTHLKTCLCLTPLREYGTAPTFVWAR